MSDIFTTRYLKFLRLVNEHEPECQQFPDVFHNEDWPQPYEAAKTAKAYCHRCPIQLDCGLYAIEANEPYGVWGGMTAAERKRIKKKLRN